jgi:hypothetical protein
MPTRYREHRTDINPKSEDCHVADILLGDYHVYRCGYFDFVWVSSVCTQYTGPPRDILSADRLVSRSLQIIASKRKQCPIC